MRRTFCTAFSKRLTISNILNNDWNTKQFDGNSVIVEGWAGSVRKMKDTVFIDISDGTSGTNTPLQVTATKSMSANLTSGCSLRVLGRITQAPLTGQFELHATELTILSQSNGPTTPILPRKNYTNDYLRQYLHLRHRTAKFAAVARVRSTATRLIHELMTQREFLHVHTPLLTCNDCEGAGETFQLAPHRGGKQFFDRPVYLTVSGQLQLEAAAHGLTRVYSLNPAFRAENSRSRLHLSEFYMLEAEQAFITNIAELISLIEGLIVELTERMIASSAKDIELASDARVDFNWVTKSFSVLDYSDAVEILRTKGLSCGGGGFGKEQELALVEYCGLVPTFVVNWPRIAKSAFYMKETDDGKVLAVDLLVPVVGEVAGGSLREDVYSKLKSRCAAGENNLDWYMDLRQFGGGVPTAGFGLGFERYLQFLCNISNIKDTILFPRWPHNCTM